MSAVHVCALAHLPASVAAIGPGSLVTLLRDATVVERPATIAPDRHLLLSFADIVMPTEGLELARKEHVTRLLEFVRAWDRRAPMLIHCHAAVSRSTAAAYISACALMPARDERALANALRRRSPNATPNALLIHYADELLSRDGRMIAAIAAIGRGEECFEGVPFALNIG